MKARLQRARGLKGALVVACCLGAVAAAPQAQANSGAGGTILNTVTVTYKDVTNTSTYQASATSSVVINTVKAALTYSGMPTAAKPGSSALLPAAQTVNSGQTANYIIALTATSNGGDTYNLSETTSGIVNMASSNVAWATLQNDGVTQISGGSPASIALGASVIQANTSNTISIPGGSTLAAAIQTNAAGHKVLVVNGVDYIVSSITAGTAPSNSNVGATYYNTLGTATPETLAVITLAANAAGSNVTPAFTANALVGQQVGEQILVKVSVNGNIGTTAGTDGKVAFDLTTTDSSSGHSTTSTLITTTFNGSNVKVQKNVRNCGSTGVGTCGATSFAANATGNPGDVLEYQVLVNNAGASQANLVAALDAVPTYTSLVSFTGAYGDGGSAGTGAATNNFATVNCGGSAATLTMQSSDNESATVASGDAAGTAAGSAIHFYLGNGNTNSAGGSLAAGTTCTILYRMKIN